MYITKTPVRCSAHLYNWPWAKSFSCLSWCGRQAVPLLLNFVGCNSPLFVRFEALIVPPCWQEEQRWWWQFGIRFRVQKFVAHLRDTIARGVYPPNNHGAIPSQTHVPPAFFRHSPTNNFWTLHTQFCAILCVFSVNLEVAISDNDTKKLKKNINGVGKEHPMLSFLSGG